MNTKMKSLPYKYFSFGVRDQGSVYLLSCVCRREQCDSGKRGCTGIIYWLALAVVK